MLRRRPLIDSLISADVADALWMDLNESIFSQLLNRQSRSRREESGISHFFDGFPDTENQGTRFERQNNVRVELIVSSKFCCPYSFWSVWKLRLHNLGYCQPVLQSFEAAPGTSSRDRVDLGCVFIQQIGNLAVHKRIH